MNDNTKRLLPLLLLSLLLHLLVLMLITQGDFNTKPALDESNTSPLRVVLKRLTKIPEVKKQQAKKQQVKTKPLSTPTLTPISVPIEVDAKDQQSRPDKPTRNVKRYSVQASVDEYFQQQSKQLQLQAFEACETYKARTGKLQCLSTAESQLTTTEDTFGFAKRINASYTQQKQLKALINNRAQLSKLIANGNFSEHEQAMLNAELEELRQDTIFLDCGGAQDTNKCSGQIQLGTAASLLLKLISK
jgi:hypothetical protein